MSNRFQKNDRPGFSLAIIMLLLLVLIGFTGFTLTFKPALKISHWDFPSYNTDLLRNTKVEPSAKVKFLGFSLADSNVAVANAYKEVVLPDGYVVGIAFQCVIPYELGDIGFSDGRGVISVSLASQECTSSRWIKYSKLQSDGRLVRVLEGSREYVEAYSLFDRRHIKLTLSEAKTTLVINKRGLNADLIKYYAGIQDRSIIKVEVIGVNRITEIVVSKR